MRVAVESTGGHVIFAESVVAKECRDSFLFVFRAMKPSPGLCFNAVLEIKCTKGIGIKGIIGPCMSLDKRESAANTSVGEGNTTEWKMCGLDKKTCLTVFFDISSIDQPAMSGTADQSFCLQFLTRSCRYQDIEGRMMLRVVTVARKWINTTANSEELLKGFDQETAAVVLARKVSLLMETQKSFDATNWLESILIGFSSYFGGYLNNSTRSFSLIHQYIFNLIHSPFIQVSHYKSDEIAYYRMMLNRESISNSIMMFQPMLKSYSMSMFKVDEPVDDLSLVSFNEEIEGLHIRSEKASIDPMRIILMDSFFQVVIVSRAKLDEWQSQGHDKSPILTSLHRASYTDAEQICKERFPVPKVIICKRNEPKAGILLKRLNASGNQAEGSNVTSTENLGHFYRRIQELSQEPLKIED